MITKELTVAEKNKIRMEAIGKTIADLEVGANWFFSNNLPAHGDFVRALIADRKRSGYCIDYEPQEKPRAYTPPKTAQETRTRPAVARTTPAEPILSPAAYQAVKQGAFVVAIVAAGALLVAYAVIPAFVALGAALSAIMAAAAPFIAAGVGCVFLGYLLFSGLFSKKNEYRQSSPNGGTTYITNIFVGQNGGVEVKH